MQSRVHPTYKTKYSDLDAKATKGLIGHPEDMPVIDGEEDILRAFCKHLEGTEGQMSETEPQSN